jgi:hypothetical protein
MQPYRYIPCVDLCQSEPLSPLSSATILRCEGRAGISQVHIILMLRSRRLEYFLSLFSFFRPCRASFLLLMLFEGFLTGECTTAHTICRNRSDGVGLGCPQGRKAWLPSGGKRLQRLPPGAKNHKGCFQEESTTKAVDATKI